MYSSTEPPTLSSVGHESTKGPTAPQQDLISYQRRLWAELIFLWRLCGRFWRMPRSSPPDRPPIRAQLLSKTTNSWVYKTPPVSAIRAIKVSQDELLLYQEYLLQRDTKWAFGVAHQKLAARGLGVLLPLVPQCLSFQANVLTEYHGIFKDMKEFPRDCAGYTMEYIRPFNQYHTKYLVKRHLSQHVHERALAGSTDLLLLAKVQMGALKPSSDRWDISLQDRPAYIDQLYAERVDVVSLASSMGSALGVLHWVCGVDAAGVDFVLGCDRSGHVQLWLIDFADCKPFRSTMLDVTTRLVDAVVQNGSCWPRWIDLPAFRNVWTVFRRSYIQISVCILEGSRSTAPPTFLPILFIDELEKTQGRGWILS